MTTITFYWGIFRKKNCFISPYTKSSTIHINQLQRDIKHKEKKTKIKKHNSIQPVLAMTIALLYTEEAKKDRLAISCKTFFACKNSTRPYNKKFWTFFFKQLRIILAVLYLKFG